MTWFDRHPEDLAEQCEPSEALAAVAAQDELTPQQLAVLDVYLNHWVVMLMLRPQDKEGVLELQHLCELAFDLAQPVPETLPFKARLEAFGDLLEGKRRVLQANAAEQAPKLLQEDKILELLSKGGCKQSDLEKSLKLGASRVSQLLGILEAQGKIVRRRTGKENTVSLPATAAPAKPETDNNREQIHVLPYSLGKDIFGTQPA